MSLGETSLAFAHEIGQNGVVIERLTLKSHGLSAPMVETPSQGSRTAA